jgi:hypothetical protein
VLFVVLVYQRKSQSGLHKEFVKRGLTRRAAIGRDASLGLPPGRLLRAEAASTLGKAANYCRVLK